MKKNAEEDSFEGDGDDNYFKNLDKLNSYLRDLDERGLVLSLAAFAEDSLGTLIKSFLIPSNSTNQLIEGFNAPLGAFSARIKFCYSSGLITKTQFEDLEHLRKIRNEFAHTWQHISFETPKIADHIKSMSHSRIDSSYPKDRAEKFRSSISCLLIEIQIASKQIRDNDKSAKLIGTEIFAGFSGRGEEQLDEAMKHLEKIEIGLQEADPEKKKFFNNLLLGFPAKLKILEKEYLKSEKGLAIAEKLLQLSKPIIDSYKASSAVEKLSKAQPKKG